MPENKPHNQFRNLVNILCVLFLFAVGIKWGWNLQAHNDFLFGDEAEYMRNGVDFFSVLRNDWGPSYNLWYKLLSLFTTDPVQLYFLNYVLGAVLAGVLIYIALERYRFHQLVALYLSFCFLLSEININTWPRVSHFIVIVLLLGLIAATYVESRAKKVLVFCSSGFIAAYSRPDLLLPFFIMLLFAIFFIYKERTQLKKLFPFILVLAGIILFFQGIFGLPASNYRGDIDRLYIAFGQHFTINYKARTHADMDPITDWLFFCQNFFPGAKTVGDIIRTHFTDVVQNSIFNLKNYLRIILETTGSFICPVKILHFKKLAYLFLAGLLGSVIYIFINPAKRKLLADFIKERWLTLLWLFVFSITSIGMCILIFPRQHYIMLHSIFIIFILACLLNVLLRNFAIKLIYLLPLFILLLIFSPTAGKYNYLQVTQDMKNLCSQKLFRYLYTKTDRPYAIFSSVLNISYPLPKNFTEFNTEYELKEGMQFTDVLKEKRINIIFVTNNLLANPLLKNDAGWQHFLNNPQEYHFNRVNYSDACSSYLLMKENP